MRHYRPLFLSEIDLRLPGVRIRKLRLNRHLTDADNLSPHRHPFSQILVYLGGAGMQVAGTRSFTATTGSIFFFPPGFEHSFNETATRRPLSLVVDLDWRGASARGFIAGRISQSDLLALRQRLSAICRLTPNEIKGNRLKLGVEVLATCEILLRSLSLLCPTNSRSHPLELRVNRALDRPRLASAKLGEIAGAVGYQRDHLNRLLKAATGSTLGQLRDARLLAHARALLADGLKVRVVAERLGFNDQNYFARWFKKQMGIPPTALFCRRRPPS